MSRSTPGSTCGSTGGVVRRAVGDEHSVLSRLGLFGDVNARLCFRVVNAREVVIAQKLLGGRAIGGSHPEQVGDGIVGQR